jgi:class 3 adenylate cyclase
LHGYLTSNEHEVVKRGSGQSIRSAIQRRTNNVEQNVVDPPDDNCEVSALVYGTAPIADLFASATVMFLDIAGFTAWSSEREPEQVSLLFLAV